MKRFSKMSKQPYEKPKNYPWLEQKLGQEAQIDVRICSFGPSMKEIKNCLNFLTSINCVENEIYFPKIWTNY